MITPLV